MWEHGEGFNGKRPFGNSGWHSELYVALVNARHIRGSFDEDGYIDTVDEVAGDRLITSAIKALGDPHA